MLRIAYLTCAPLPSDFVSKFLFGWQGKLVLSGESLVRQIARRERSDSFVFRGATPKSSARAASFRRSPSQRRGTSTSLSKNISARKPIR